RGIGRSFIWLGVISLCASLLLGLLLRVVLGISLVEMTAIVVLVPILLYVMALGGLSFGLLTRARQRRRLAPSFYRRPHDDDGGGLGGVREPRRPLAPSGTARAVATSDNEEAPW